VDRLGLSIVPLDKSGGRWRIREAGVFQETADIVDSYELKANEVL
jgi:hypothetical protein